MIQNDDIKVRVTLQDNTATAVDISTLDFLEFYLYNIENGLKAKKATYKLGNTGYYAVNVVDSANGIVDIVINRQLSRTLPVGKYYIEAKVRLTGSSEYIGSVYNVGGMGVEIDTMYQCSNNNTLL